MRKYKHPAARRWQEQFNGIILDNVVDPVDPYDNVKALETMIDDPNGDVERRKGGGMKIRKIAARCSDMYRG